MKIVVVLGFILATSFITSFLSRPGRAQAPYPVACQTWPPAPEKIVNGTGRSGMQPGDVITLYTVPVDSYFILTRLQAILQTGGLDLLEQNGSNTTPKVLADLLRADPYTTTYLDFQPTHIGVVFAPGSNVLVQHVGGGFTDVPYAFTGYLADR